MTYPNVLINEIREGMAVFDKENSRVGTVDLAFAGEGDYVPEANFGIAPTAPAVRAALDTDRLPTEVRDRLLGYGFVKLSTGGLFPGTRFATPDQVSDVDMESNSLHLSVEGKALLKG